MNHPWVIIAAGFHQKGGMDKANHALADYLLEREIPVHLVTHSVDPLLEQHRLATVHLVARPAKSFYLGEFALAARGRKVARRVLREHPLAQAIGNDWKGKVAATMYLVGILLAFVAPWVSCLLYATVAAIWFIPDRRIESRIKQ